MILLDRSRACLVDVDHENRPRTTASIQFLAQEGLRIAKLDRVRFWPAMTPRVRLPGDRGPGGDDAIFCRGGDYLSVWIHAPSVQPLMAICASFTFHGYSHPEIFPHRWEDAL